MKKKISTYKCENCSQTIMQDGEEDKIMCERCGCRMFRVKTKEVNQ